MDIRTKVAVSTVILNILFILMTANNTGFDSLLVSLYMLLSMPAMFIAFIVSMNLGEDNLFVVILITSIYWFIISWLISYFILPKTTTTKDNTVLRT